MESMNEWRAPTSPTLSAPHDDNGRAGNDRQHDWPEARPKVKTIDARYSGTQKATLGAAIAAMTVLVGAHMMPGAGRQDAPQPVAQHQAIQQIATQQTAHSAVQLALIAPENAENALRHSTLPAADQARLLQGVQDGDLKLATMPVFDAAGASGHVISVTSAGVTQTATLTPTPHLLIVGIPPTGQIEIAATGPTGASGTTVGMFSPVGAVALPTFSAMGQGLAVNVIVQ
ncbi:hypothetical protein Tasa_025_006 [Tanticharoenia sakaeratensis NBRC 103193]|uniref:Uncharacterized protein n=2 Tax=Tanticharoenia TaxID=444052 RepID=A0A0D6MMC0_9PROT|nr:hypothetical protein Tasa_025_006 [Tanticharoenia sakaeratensis NBRC 103193]